MTMKRKIILAIAAIIASLSAASAQTSEETFQRHNRWMVGGEFVRNILHANGGGVTGIYGRQFSEIVFLGVGFGVDTYIYKAGKSTTTITDADGTQTVIIRPPYRYSFLVPVYADLQVNFSRRKSPFFGEFKVGGAVHMGLERIRGTHNKNELDFWGGGVLMGAAAGKRFALNNDDELSLFLGIDCILGPWYANVPVSLGIRYGF
jgi:hypothetical protein